MGNHTKIIHSVRNFLKKYKSFYKYARYKNKKEIYGFRAGFQDENHD